MAQIKMDEQKKNSKNVIIIGHHPSIVIRFSILFFLLLAFFFRFYSFLCSETQTNNILFYYSALKAILSLLFAVNFLFVIFPLVVCNSFSYIRRSIYFDLLVACMPSNFERLLVKILIPDSYILLNMSF